MVETLLPEVYGVVHKIATREVTRPDPDEAVLALTQRLAQFRQRHIVARHPEHRPILLPLSMTDFGLLCRAALRHPIVLEEITQEEKLQRANLDTDAVTMVAAPLRAVAVRQEGPWSPVAADSIEPSSKYL